MSFTYCLYDTNQMTPEEAATFMLSYGDYVTYEHLVEAANAAFLDLSDKPKHYEAAIFSTTPVERPKQNV